MKKYSVLNSATLLFLATILFFACKKDVSTENSASPDNGVDLSTKITTSVSGFITDENNNPVQGAVVSAGIKTTTTDQYGYFQIKNVSLTKIAAFVTVSKTGYFKGVKTWVAGDNRSGFFRIKLLPKANAGTVSGSTGGNITLTSGMKISFPAAAFVTVSSGAAYNGTVTVKAQWLDPLSSDLSNTMPGDLRAINSSGDLKLLTTYGMTAVELEGSGGELLQIAAGKKATLTMPIPASLAASAPVTISLWYFDETNGLWKEDGSAVKTGSVYTGDVSHFTYWNCDIPGPQVQVSLRILNTNNQPVGNVYIDIRLAGTTGGNSVHAYTDADGYATGPAPAGAALSLNVWPSGNSCGTPISAMNFTTTNSNVNLGDIIISGIQQGIANISGSVMDCNNQPVTSGRVMIYSNFNWGIINISPNGTYATDFGICSPYPATIVADDFNSNIQSNVISTTIVPGTNNIPLLQACSLSTNEYVTYTLNGVTNISFTTPTDTIRSYPYYTGTNTAGKIIQAGHIGNLERIIFSLTPANYVVGLPVSIGGFSYYNNTGVQQYSGPVIITSTITEYGQIGQYAGGTFSGTVTISGASVPIIGSFRIKRNF